MVERPTPKLPAGTAPRIWLGANFWSRIGGPLMWRSFEAEIVGQELRALREHGLNVTRSFFYWPDFMPAPDTIDEECVGRYGRFLDLCGEVGISTIPTFIVGHMSGENWDVPWRNGRDLYADGWMLAQQAFFIREMARRFKDHPSVAGWLISNEMPLYGGTTEPEYARSWGQLMVQAVRAAGATQPVSLGDGTWGIEVTGTDNGFRLRDLAPVVDFVGPHVYPMGNDPLRQHLTAAFNCELSHFGKPVILEEFGLTTDFASEEHAGDYYRQAPATGSAGRSGRTRTSGCGGVVYTSPASPWMERIRPIIEKKARLGVDAWGGTDAEIRDVMGPLEELFAKEYPDYEPFPFGTQREIELLVRNILLAEPMLPEYGERFRGMSETEIEGMMRSFRFENCVKRDALAGILAEYAEQKV